MTPAQALAALCEALGYELRNVSSITADPWDVTVEHVTRDAEDRIVLDNGVPVLHHSVHRIDWGTAS
jgi:hypothetical protein